MLLLLQFNPFFAAIIAAALSFAIALVFLDRQRDAMSEAVAKKLSRDSSGRYQDDLSSEEDRILDLEAKADQSDAGPNQDGKPYARKRGQLQSCDQLTRVSTLHDY